MHQTKLYSLLETIEDELNCMTVTDDPKELDQMTYCLFRNLNLFHDMNSDRILWQLYPDSPVITTK